MTQTMSQPAFERLLMRPQTFVAQCYGCEQEHFIEFRPGERAAAFADWRAKHSGPNCLVSFRRPYKSKRHKRLAEFAHNSDIKVAYGASSTITITAASLASDTNLLAGRESDGISNASNKYADVFWGGKVTTGTSPTASRRIEIWAAGAVNDTPDYPDVFDGTDSNETVTSSDIKYGGLALVAVLGTGSTSDVTYWMHPTSLLQVFSGVIPIATSMFIVHNTAVNLNATSGNHAFKATGVYYTSI